MNQLRTPAGRLVLIDVATPVTGNEIDTLDAELKEALERIPKDLVICVNLTHAELLPPHISAGYINIMRADNSYVLRSGFWVSDTGLFGQQMERMLAQAKNPRRRLFRQRIPLEGWLSEVTTADELAALRAHLNAMS